METKVLRPLCRPLSSEAAAYPPMEAEGPGQVQQGQCEVGQAQGKPPRGTHF